MSEVTVSTPEATAQEPVADDPQQSIAAGMDAPSSERDPPVPVVTTGSGVTVSNSKSVAQRKAPTDRITDCSTDAVRVTL